MWGEGFEPPGTGAFETERSGVGGTRSVARELATVNPSLFAILTEMTHPFLRGMRFSCGEGAVWQTALQLVSVLSPDGDSVFWGGFEIEIPKWRFCDEKDWRVVVRLWGV